MPRKTTKPAPPVILTAEQIEAKARRDAAADAYVAAREVSMPATNTARKPRLSPVQICRIDITGLQEELAGVTDSEERAEREAGIVEMKSKLARLLAWYPDESDDD